jgi:predicted O-methyltransferase YrrM
LRQSLLHFLDEIERLGLEHDACHTERRERYLMVGGETGRFLYVLLSATRYEHVLELGTGTGYSTIWLAEAVSPHHGLITTIENDESKQGMALAHFRKANLEAYVKPLLGDIGELLQTFRSQVDVIFLDAERSSYVHWWNDINRLLRPGGLLIVDNALSPKPEELIEFFEVVKGTGDYFETLVPTGNGLMLFYKKP